MNNIKEKFLSFVKYHNGFTIGLVLVLFGGGVIFAASPEARDAVGEAIGGEAVAEIGVDNSQIIAADLEKLDFKMKVENVTEDGKNYYVEYSFSTLGIQDNAWQAVARLLTMTIDKASLQGMDLGLYVQKQFNEIAQNELSFLKTARAAELAKGETKTVKTTEYTGLIGLVLDMKSALLPGYEAVVVDDEPEEGSDEPAESDDDDGSDDSTSATSTKETGSKSSDGSKKTSENEKITHSISVDNASTTDSE